MKDADSHDVVVAVAVVATADDASASIFDTYSMLCRWVQHNTYQPFACTP